ncbi:MAG: DNA mismatch repair endonuclease MutL [Deltaproteobacteria bacterium]|nr:DNA mismatch repair endonuclease MutL [Deltaproteobacteria bacterium]
MKRIEVLSSVVADQIAAGEVIERPASIIKELVENSIDANATSIQVEVDSGGIGRIRIFDNGDGFPKQDVETAFLRHATSKISNIDDILNINSYGFRGEALASIAAVSKLTVLTRTDEDVAGKKLVIHGGRTVENKDAGCPVGTDFEIRDLFYNVPARLKFLKRESTETSHCIEAVTRMALIRPDISFKIISKGRVVKKFIKTDEPAKRVKDLFKDEPLALAKGEENGVAVTAILGPPDRARAGGGSLYTYVNGRYIRDKALLGAVSRAFAGTLDKGRYPVGYISITVPPTGVDVNVHPQKTEVRFANTQAVFRAVSHVVGAMVARSPWVKKEEDLTDINFNFQQGDNAKFFEINESNLAYDSDSDNMVPPPSGLKFPDINKYSSLDEISVKTEKSVAGSVNHDNTRSSFTEAGTGADTETVPRQENIPLQNSFSKSLTLPSGAGVFSSMSFIGQAKGTFLLFEDGDDLVVMDQHAAHERVTYENLRTQLLDGRVKSQRLITPHNVDLGPSEADRIEEHKDELSKLGLDIERSGEDRISIYSVPSEVGGASPDKLLAETVIAIEEGREGSGGDMEDKAVATIACHGSIRAGRKVLKEEVDSLLMQMDKIDFAGHCPHGRPVLTRLSWREIAKKVGR